MSAPASGVSPFTRREFLNTAAFAAAACAGGFELSLPAAQAKFNAVSVADLPAGTAPAPVELPHFPSRLHAFVWRNWPLVPLRRLAAVVGARPADLERLARRMGLSPQPRIPSAQQRRSYLTIIRRNWHLLPYEQLLALLDWTPAKMAFVLREDDFLFVKLGNLKPACPPIRFQPGDATTRAWEEQIAQIIRAEFPQGFAEGTNRLFNFVEQLSSSPKLPARAAGKSSSLHPRFCYSYFALYGDPLLEPGLDPYPDGLLARLANAGVDGVWLQAVLSKLAPFPWDAEASARCEERLQNLRALVARARRRGIGIWLYLNEPRAWPLAFFERHPELRGVVAGDHATLCTSHPAVQNYLRDAVAHVARAVPDLAGFFTITASENLTNCWSHNGGAKCPRCGARAPAEVLAELNGIFRDGIRRAGSGAQLIAWDWGWADVWAPGIIERLPRDVALMSVSEWSIPIQRGGVDAVVGEYSISTIGPGPRAQRHWALARARGLKTIAKVQAGNTWELSAVPYIPALANVAQHAANLRAARVDGLMLGWTLGGYPSPNLEVMCALAPSPTEAMLQVAQRRFGEALAPAAVQAWHAFSASFSEFPYHGGTVYSAPMQFGPSNLLWTEPTNYRATMIGFPYDDLDAWRAVYPAEIFIQQFEKVADGFERSLTTLRETVREWEKELRSAENAALAGELNVAEAAAIHFRTTANQSRFIVNRRALAAAKTLAEAHPLLVELEKILRSELALARQLHAVQSRDARIGFEASNQYYFVPIDLAEKVLNCRRLLDDWLPKQRARWNAR